jgi:hypothetical protein
MRARTLVAGLMVFMAAGTVVPDEAAAQWGGRWRAIGGEGARWGAPWRGYAAEVSYPPGGYEARGAYGEPGSYAPPGGYAAGGYPPPPGGYPPPAAAEYSR